MSFNDDPSIVRLDCKQLLTNDPDPADAGLELSVNDLHVASVPSAAPVAIGPAVHGQDVRVATLNVGQGLQRKLAPLLRWANEQDVHVLAVQETGLCSDVSSVLRSWDFSMAIAPARHAGVALFLHESLHSSVVREMESDTGRLVGVLVEAQGVQTLLVSCYMPTSMDRVSLDSESAQLCTSLYAELLRWVASLPASANVVVLGDLNETIA